MKKASASFEPWMFAYQFLVRGSIVLRVDSANLFLM